ncbi:LAFE_0G12860g1_1 [Lachancea fermentati]|uniref:Probable vacuolar protein sorting-associated protein 16 homolog n=1 Tax=Lachancea fermentati TaxID=4955 RepID=A0A1G4MIH1_LACFM|nr:LAFE_0G12860g1_1 [Lachancea fermentati]
MVLRNPCLGWEKLEDVYYRSRELCSLSWPTDGEYKYTLSTTLVAIEAERSVQIYHYTGRLLTRISLDNLPGPVISYEFDAQDEESLVIVMPNCLRKYHSWAPLQFQDFFLPEDVEDTIWDYRNRVAILQESQDIYHFNGLSINLLCRNNEKFTLLTKGHWHCNEDLIVLLDVNHVLHLNIAEGSLKEALPGERWHIVIVSPRGFVCLYNSKTNALRIYKNPERTLLETSLDKFPNDIEWCGDDTVACSFEGEEIKLYGPNLSYVAFWYPDDIMTLKTEIDGLKLISKEKIYFISKVQECTANTFLIGSTESSAILLDSMNLLSTQAPRAVENLKIINLDQAVSECLSAALEEFEPLWQKKLLSAASFGKSSLVGQSFDANYFVRNCDMLRVLNTLKELGIFLTARQFEHMTLDGIITRLIMSHDFYECIKICLYLKQQEKIPRVFKTWANTKIMMSPEIEDEELFQSIKNLAAKQSMNLPMARIGETAFFEGRFNLARKLILLEPLPEIELPLLLELDDNELALKEGKRWGISRITLSILLELQRKLTVAQFSKILILIMQENELFSYYARDDERFLYDYYRQTDNFLDLARLTWKQGRRSKIEEQYIPQVEELYSKVLNNALIKDDKELLTRQSELYKFQESLASQHQKDFLHLNMDETIAQMVALKLDKPLVAFLKKFQVSEKKFYHIKCRTLAQEQRFNDLYKFAREKKSPIGYYAFYRQVFKQNHKKEAAVYIEMISGLPYEKILKMYLKCNAYSDAIQLATKEKDIQGLKSIYKIIPANEPQLKSLITENMNKI